MTRTQLIRRSLRFYWRTNLGVIAGVAIATAVIVGALVVGDSVRHSLLRMALNRLADTHFAVSTGDRLFRENLAWEIGAQIDDNLRPRDSGWIHVAPALKLSGVASADGGQRQANDVQVIGIGLEGMTPRLKGGPVKDVVLNQRLAAQLGVAVGDQVLLRVAKPSALPRDVPLGSEVEDSVRLAMTVLAILPEDDIGSFSLEADQIPPFNAFVPLERLQEAIEAPERINMMLVRGPGDAEPVTAGGAEALADHWTLADVQLELQFLPGKDQIELRSSRVFLDPPAVEAAFAADASWTKLLTYFVNELASDGKTTPYSMVTAMDASAFPRAGVRDDQIVVTQWLAEDLDLQVGDPVTLTYWIVGEGRKLIEQKATFSVHSIVPTSGTGAIGDRAMMPDFPGIADAEDSRNWEPGIPINLDLIRDKDEAYWDEFRGTPKAFVTLNWAQEHWGNRFGGLTALRLPASSATIEPEQIASKIRAELDPASAGLFFRPVRAEAIAASQQGTDFGGLFIGLSMFLVIAALLLTALLFVFGVEQRAAETGTLLAVGYTPGQVRRLWLIEGGVLAVIGAMLGLALGVGYTHGVLWALQNIWSAAVIESSLVYHATWMSLAIGAAAGVLTALAAMWWVLRRQARQPTRVLLAARFDGEESPPAPGSGRRWALWLGLVCFVGALVLLSTLIAKPQAAGAGGFFGAGSLLLVSGLLLSAALLGRSRAAMQTARFTTASLAWRNSTRRRGRSLATITMLACGTFLIVSINAFRHDPTHAIPTRSSGTGGFALYAETALPVYHDLNAAEGREAFGLDEGALADVSIVQMRLKPGDEASCLNLNAPRQPTLIGVDPRKLAERDAFTFVGAMEESEQNPWLLLSRADDQPDAPVPAIVDQSVAQWILKKGIGDMLPDANEPPFIDERGRPYRIQIVGTLGNSVLQGSLVISDRQFAQHFPGVGGYRVMLVDAPWHRMDEVKQELERALSDVGIVAMPTPQRLALFSAVENTYLTIFGVLGGLGLVLGCIGLALVVLRNVLERRSELALMRSVGFTPGKLRWLVLSEHWTLVVLGLLLGVIAAALAIVPALQHETDLPVTSLAVTLIAIGVSALAWTAVAAGMAVRGRLVEALRNE